MKDRLESLAHGTGKHATWMLPGADVSVWQGPPVDWREQAGRISWAAVKFTEVQWENGQLVASLNPDAAADWQYLKDSGKGRIAYLYGHPDTPAAATAQMFAAAVTDHGLDDGDGIALDLEITGGKTAAEVATWSDDVAALLQRDLGRLPLIYTFIAFALAGNCSGLGRYPLWIADPSSPAGHPRVPPPWATWTVHQFSWTPLDRDVARFQNVAAMQSALGKTATTDPHSRKDDQMPNGYLLQPGPTPIRAEQRNLDPYSQLLLAACKDAQQAELTVSVLDADGAYDVHVSLDWEHPGIVSFRHPRRTKAVSVERTDAGTDAVAWLLT